MRYITIFFTIILCQTLFTIQSYAETLKSEVIVAPGAKFIAKDGNKTWECTLGFLGYSRGRKIALSDAGCDYKVEKNCSASTPKLECNLVYTPAGIPLGSFEHSRHNGVDTLAYIVLLPEIKINPLINAHKIRNAISIQDSSIKNICIFTQAIGEKCGGTIQISRKDSHSQLVFIPALQGSTDHIWGAPLFALTPQGMKAVAVVTGAGLDSHKRLNGGLRFGNLGPFLAKWNIHMA